MKNFNKFRNSYLSSRNSDFNNIGTKFISLRTSFATHKSKIAKLLVFVSISAYFFNKNKKSKYLKDEHTENLSYTLLNGINNTFGAVIKNFTSSKLRCDSPIDSRYGKDSIENLEDSLNKKSKIDNEQSSKGLDDSFDYLEGLENIEEIQQLMNNPDMDPEAYKELMAQSSQAKYTPPPFKSISTMFRCNDDDETWNGFKLQAEYSPMDSFKFDTEHTFQPGKKTHRFSLVSMFADKTDPSRGIFMVARNDPSFVSSTQIHANFTKTDRLSFIANYRNNDMSQGMYELEYNKSVDRMNLSGKLSNHQGNSVSCTVNVWKNVHLGVESTMNPQNGDLMLSYGLNFKPLKNLGISAVYLSTMPLYSFDILYRVIF